MPTVAQVIQSAMLELSQVPGLATQTYATPRLAKFVEDAFFMMFDDEHHWNAYCEWITLQVANGQLAEDVVGPHNIKVWDYRDILYVHPDGSNRPLRELGTLINPASITGSVARYKAPSHAVPYRPFRIYPTTFTGAVQAYVRARPAQPFASTQELHLDLTALSKGASFMYLASTGTNGGHAASLQAQFIARVNQVKAQENDGIIEKDMRHLDTGTDDWHEMP